MWYSSYDIRLKILQFEAYTYLIDTQLASKLYLLTSLLYSISSVAALIAGFDVVVLVELNYQADVPEWLLALLCATNALTVCLMTLAFVTCTLMLVGTLKAFDIHNMRQPFAQFWINQCKCVGIFPA